MAFPKTEFKVQTTPHDLKRRIANVERWFNRKMRTAMKHAMKAVHFSVPRPYPPKPPGSTYVRTGMLGSMLGFGMRGAIFKTDPPIIYRFKRKALGEWEGNVGADRPWYVGRVVGLQQEYPWKSYWWNESDWRDKAEPEVQKAYFEAAEDIGRYLSGQSEKLKDIP